MFKKDQQVHPEAEFALLERSPQGEITENSYIVTAGDDHHHSSANSGINKLFKDKITKIRPRSFVSAVSNSNNSNTHLSPTPSSDSGSVFSPASPSAHPHRHSKAVSLSSSQSHSPSLLEPSQELLDVLAQVDPTNERLIGVSRVSQYFPNTSSPPQTDPANFDAASSLDQHYEPKESPLASSIMSSFGTPQPHHQPLPEPPVQINIPNDDIDDPAYDSDVSFKVGDEKRMSVLPDMSPSMLPTSPHFQTDFPQDYYNQSQHLSPQPQPQPQFQNDTIRAVPSYNQQVQHENVRSSSRAQEHYATREIESGMAAMSTRDAPTPPAHQTAPKLVLPSQDPEYSPQLMQQYEDELSRHSDSRDHQHHQKQQVPALAVFPADDEPVNHQNPNAFETAAKQADDRREKRRSFFRPRSRSRGRDDEHASQGAPAAAAVAPPPAVTRQQQAAEQKQWEHEAESLALHIPAPEPGTSAKKPSKLSLFTGRHRASSEAASTHSAESLTPVTPSSPFPGAGGGPRSPRPTSPYLAQQPQDAMKSMEVTFSRSTDEKLQQAIDLHEAGSLEESLVLFTELANPQGINHPLAQVLCGLSYRHGWGTAPDADRAFQYLRIAAENSAMVDQIASLGNSSGSFRANPRNKSKSGLAKGELVLAIFELGNCFRYGWGTTKDPVLAKRYYETAARLGDVDAMVETAWCYMNGFGMKKKDKYTAAQFYRMAERAGREEVGNSWIWKDKYDPK